MSRVINLTKKLRTILMVAFGGGRCPKCGEWIDEGDDCCQTCGYPWNN